MEEIAVPAAALAIDEFYQMSATLLHANAVRHAYGRAREHRLRVDDYMKVNELLAECRWCRCLVTIFSCHQCQKAAVRCGRL